MIEWKWKFRIVLYSDSSEQYCSCSLSLFFLSFSLFYFLIYLPFSHCFYAYFRLNWSLKNKKSVGRNNMKVSGNKHETRRLNNFLARAQYRVANFSHFVYYLIYEVLNKFKLKKLITLQARYTQNSSFFTWGLFLCICRQALNLLNSCSCCASASLSRILSTDKEVIRKS